MRIEVAQPPDWPATRRHDLDRTFENPADEFEDLEDLEDLESGGLLSAGLERARCLLRESLTRVGPG